MKSGKSFIYDQILLIRYMFGHTKKYHSGKRKSSLQILKDLIVWQFKEGRFNNMYYAMGLDQKGSKQSDYIGRVSFLKIREKAEKKLKINAGCAGLSYQVITKDKFYANAILMANEIPCIGNFALISGSYLILPDGRKENIDSVLHMEEPFFIKNIVLEAGEGVYRCRIVNKKIELNNEYKNLDEFNTFLADKIWILQKQYYSHEAIRKINASALNTTRIVTISNGREPQYLCGFQGFATKGAQIDSWSHGSVYVGINRENECLTGYGITSPSDKRQGLLQSHPDSGIIFGGYPIPFLKETVDLCIKAHRLFYFNFIIGWDVAITDKGPLIVEANEKPGLNVAQSLNGGLKEKIFQHASQILN